MRKRRTDANHADAMAWFRALGCAVFDAHSVAGGFPDLVVLTPSERVVLVEVKDGAKPPSARRLTPAAVEFCRRWPVSVCTSAADAGEIVRRAATRTETPLQDDRIPNLTPSRV